MKFLINYNSTLILVKKNLLFVFIVLLHILPFLFLNHVVTLDGAAHSYNARILKALLLNESNKINFYYSINNIIVPNYFGHILMLFFNLFFPVIYSEKLLQITYVISFLCSFRYFIRSLGIKNDFSIFLISPFVFSFFFFLGFYNFLFGIVFLLITTGYWIKNFYHSYHKNILLPLLFLATYLSHVFVFILLNVFVLSYLLQVFISQYFVTINKLNFTFYIKKIILYLLSSSLPIYLTFVYFSVQPAPIHVSYVAFSEKIQWLYNFRPLISFNFNTEKRYTYLFLIGYIFIILYYGFVFTKRFFLKKDDVLKKSIFKNFWLIVISFLLLFLLFFMYDSDGWAGYISLRLAFLVSFVWIVILISLFSDVGSKYILYLTTIYVLSVNIFFQSYHFKSLKNLSKEFHEIIKLSDFIKPYSTISYINLHSNWMLTNLPMYIGVNAPAILLNNYEANTNYFPLVWSETFNNKRNQICLQPLSVDVNNSCLQTKNKTYCIDVDYLFIMGVDSTQCANSIGNYLQDSYALRYHQGHYMLFEHKSNI